MKNTYSTYNSKFGFLLLLITYINTHLLYVSSAIIHTDYLSLIRFGGTFWLLSLNFFNSIPYIISSYILITTVLISSFVFIKRYILYKDFKKWEINHLGKYFFSGIMMILLSKVTTIFLLGPSGILLSVVIFSWLQLRTLNSIKPYTNRKNNNLEKNIVI